MPKKGEVTLQITVTPALKADVDDLAMSTRQKVSDMLRPIIQKLVELNMARIENYRNDATLPLVLPYFDNQQTDETPKKKASPKKKKPTAQVETPPPDAAPDESAGVTNEN